MATRIEVDPNALAAIQNMADDYVANTVLPAIAEKAKRIVPVDTGHLQANIKPEVSGAGMFVVADTEYAAFVEEGTSKMAAQPYLRPAMTTALQQG